MVLDYKGRNDIGNWTCINFLQYVQSMWRFRTPSMLRAGYQTLFTWSGGGVVRFDQAQDQQVVTTRSPRIVPECSLTRSRLIKMYVYAIYSRFRIGTILSIRKHGYEFITTQSLPSLMSLLRVRMLGEANIIFRMKKTRNIFLFQIYEYSHHFWAKHIDYIIILHINCDICTKFWKDLKVLAPKETNRQWIILLQSYYYWSACFNLNLAFSCLLYYCWTYLNLHFCRAWFSMVRYKSSTFGRLSVRLPICA